MSVTFTHDNEEMTIELSTYPNGSPRVVIYSETGEPYASLGTPSFPIKKDGKIVLNDNIPYKAAVNVLVESGVVEEIEDVHISGGSAYGVYKITNEELLKYYERYILARGTA